MRTLQAVVAAPTLGVLVVGIGLGLAWAAGAGRAEHPVPDVAAAPAQVCARHSLYAPLASTRLRVPYATARPGQALPPCAPTAPATPQATAVTATAATPGTDPAPTATADMTTGTPGQPPFTETPGGPPPATGSPPATATSVPPQAGDLFGVQVFEADLEAIRHGRLDGAGASWVRARVLWAAVEPRDTDPPTRNWTMSDAVVGAAAQRGLKIVLNVYHNPDWAASTVCGPVDRVPLERFEAFVRDVVERYDGDGVNDAPGSPRVDHYEFYNEPDFDREARAAHPEFGDPVDGYGGCFGPQAGAYADVLRTAHRATKSVDPSAGVVFGAVAYDRFYDNDAFTPRGPFRYGFVRDVLRSSHERYGQEPGWPFFDWMAFHNYNDFRNNWDGADGRAPEIIGKAAHLRSNQLVAPGLFDLSAMPLVNTEVGLASGPSDAWTERSETYQAAYVGQVFSRAMAAGLGLAVWYTAQDYASGACDNPYDWLAVGLLRSTWVAERAAACTPSPLPGYEVTEPHQPKLAHRAYAAAAAVLGAATYDRRLTVAETGAFVIEAHRVTLADGRAALVAFTDHGDRLGRRGAINVAADLTVGPVNLPGWTGRARVTSYLGEAVAVGGPTVTVPLTFAPTYIEVLP